MTNATTFGPFPTLSTEQWKEVKNTHNRFTSPKGLGRPLGIFPHAFALPDAARLTGPDTEIRLAGSMPRVLEYDETIREFIVNAAMLAQSKHRRDAFPVIFIRRGFYGHSQRLSEPFGTTVELEGPGGHLSAQARPSISSMSEVAHLKLKPVKDCPWLSKSLKVLQYYMDSTAGHYHIPHMVTTGPCDTVNYATGSTLLLESFYTHPKEMHQLLRMATDLIIEHILACKRIAGDRLIADHTYLLDGAYCICSEIRSQFSPEHYAEFEAPYLKEIGEAVGKLHIHVSGPIEHSVPATLQDTNITHYKFWLRDCNLKRVSELVGNRVSMDFFCNDCMPQIGFKDSVEFYKYIFLNTRPESRWTIPHTWFAGNYPARPLAWTDAFNLAYDELDKQGTLPAGVRAFGKIQ
ncbi:MAG: hypothetical protein A2340_15165 [Lentisphaerae bacterium RIFOXYB12_FULL_60_10]|nr:MAG: hypothetical protein A2340_15165 [Lentisphaerae bacterium RIFOXYB12_FULL_60_10]